MNQKIVDKIKNKEKLEGLFEKLRAKEQESREGEGKKMKKRNGHRNQIETSFSIYATST